MYDDEITKYIPIRGNYHQALLTSQIHTVHHPDTGLILGLRPANKRRRYEVTMTYS